ncbi:hypothetical protein [Streptomyces sp. NPDC053069]|uniref:hypothetical protein n=1 Tax=Streptomyces sp. NPDC053069 TaxID=3365695 RepID=UPI0037CF2AE6
MSRDTGGGPVKRPRALERARVGWPSSLQELKDLLYEVYLAAGTPSLDEIAADIAKNDRLPGSPSRDTVRRCISDPVLPPGQADVVAVSVVLARRAAWDQRDLAGRVRELWVATRMARGAGRPIGDFDDRLVLDDLEVHRALHAGDGRERLGALPAYVPREFDARLDAVVATAAAGKSGIAVLVGGSSTGKTRALWEAARKLPDAWRLWHPITPTRPDAVLAELPDIAPRTVVWLNEAQHYLGPDPIGEEVAAGLRNLLRDPARGPVLVLATLWPGHWQSLTTRTTVDRHAQARELLSGYKIDVPEAFTHADLVALTETASTDSRLKEAAEHAHAAQITQYLAGVPVLTDRYRTATGATRALIHAAMDVRRLGAAPYISLAWLADAAPGYLTEAEWNTTENEWLAQALDYVTQGCNGIPGILTPVKTTTPRNPRNGRNRRSADVSSLAAGQPARGMPGPHYQLADYLDQYGRLHRADQIPPIDFWTAAANHAHPADLTALSNAASQRGLHRDAAQLRKRATHSDPRAAAQLLRQLHRLCPTDRRPAQWVVDHVSLDDEPDKVVQLLTALRDVGTSQQFTDLLARDPAAHVTVDDAYAVGRLLKALSEVAAHEQAAALAERAARQAPLDDPSGVAFLMETMREIGCHEQVAVILTGDPAAHVTVDDAYAVGRLLKALSEVAAHEQAAALAERAARQAPLDDRHAAIRLLESMREVGAYEQAAALAERAARYAPLDSKGAASSMLKSLQKAGAYRQAARLAERAAAQGDLDNPADVTWLLDRLLRSKSYEQTAALLAHDPAAHVTLDDHYALIKLLKKLREAGAHEQAAALEVRVATHIIVGRTRALSPLEERLRKSGVLEQVTTLLARDPEPHVALRHPFAMRDLLEELGKLQYHEQVEALTDWAVSHIDLDRPSAVAWFLVHLCEVGAHDHAVALAERAARHPISDDWEGVARLLKHMWHIQAHEQATALAQRAAAHFALHHPYDVSSLLARLWETGCRELAAAVATGATAHIAADSTGAVSSLLGRMARVAAREEAAALAERTTPYAGLEDPRAVKWLLERLSESGYHQQMTVLLARDPASHAALHDSRGVYELWAKLQEVGAHEQATRLAERLPAAGHFDLYIQMINDAQRFMYGREPDGSAAAPWTWEDLE